MLHTSLRVRAQCPIFHVHKNTFYTQLNKPGAKKVTREVTAIESDSGRTLVDFLQTVLKVPKEVVLDKIYAREVQLVNRKVSKLKAVPLSGRPKSTEWQRAAQERLPFRLIVKPGDVYNVEWIEPLKHVPKEDLLRELAESLRKQIVYKDEHIVVIDKPPSLVQGASLKTSLTVQSSLPFLLPNTKQPLRMVHLIDKDSTGLVLLARTEEATQRMGRLFSSSTSDQLERTYNAMLYVHSAQIFRHNIRPAMESNDWTAIENTVASTYNPKTNRKQMCVLTQPERVAVEDLDYVRQAKTLWRTVNVFGPTSDRRNWLVQAELRPCTNRKHQLRLHCSSNLEAPILGDYRYRFKDRYLLSLFPGKNYVPMFLHHQKIKIKNYHGPGKHLEVTAPLPAQFTRLFRELEKEGFTNPNIS